MKLKKDDLVTIIAGKDKGKSGRKGRVVVQDRNIVKKAMRPKNQQDKGGIVEIEASIDASNVMINCKKCGPTRIRYAVDGDKKIRTCCKCGEVL